MTSCKRETERLPTELRALESITCELMSQAELSPLLNLVLEKTISTLDPADVGLVMLWDPSAGVFRAAAALGYDSKTIRQFEPRIGESITGKVYGSGEPTLLNSPKTVAEAMSNIRPVNLSVLERSLGRDPMPNATLAVPVFSGDQKFGVLILESVQGDGYFSHEDVCFAQIIANLIAMAIDNINMKSLNHHIQSSHEVALMRSDVMATLSHELRMPLTSIKGYSTAMTLDDVFWEPEKIKLFLKLIDTEVDEMQSMIKDLLDSALIDVGQMKLELQPVRLQYIARDVAGEIQRYSEIHRIVCNFSPDYPIIEADPRWIKQVFRNVLENAVKYSPDGGLIVVQGEVRQEDVVVRVADQGIGISPEDLIPLFEKYFRVRSTERLHVSGTGLGLPVARSIVEAHGGRIWAESQLGEGTTIHFSLPKSKLLAMELSEEGNIQDCSPDHRHKPKLDLKHERTKS